MQTRWNDMKCANIAIDHLRLLADLRLHSELSVFITGDRAWITWNAANAELRAILIRCLLPLQGVETFEYRDPYWYRPGQHLPALDVPPGLSDRFSPSALTLAQVFIPAATRFEMPEKGDCKPQPIRIVRDDRDRAQPTTAVHAPLEAVLAWADAVPAGELARFEAVWSNAELLLIGREGTLPLLSAGSRFWGSGVLVPLGFRIDPDLPVSALRRLAGATADELVLWNHEGCERIDRELFSSLDRARLASANISVNRTHPNLSSRPTEMARSDRAGGS